MKKLIHILSFTLLIIAGYTQNSINYQCFLPDVEYVFEYNNLYKSVSYDSIVDLGDVQKFVGFKVLEYESDTCLNDEGKNWIGGDMIFDNAGNHWFFNFTGDSILINPTKNINEAWICFTFSNGDYIEASIHSFDFAQFLGLSDSVKTIQFQAKNASGQNIGHPVNDKEIWISKSYGMIKTINFRAFPDLVIPFWNTDCQEYDLVGMDDPEVGIQNLSYRDVFDFDIGDEIHTKTEESFFNQYHKWYFAKTVIGKEIGDNSVTYVLARCGLDIFGFTQPGFVNDTVYQTIDFNDPIANRFALPLNQCISEQDTNTIANVLKHPWMEMVFDDPMNQLQKIVDKNFYSAPPSNCVKQISNEENFLDTYIKGLGGPYYDIQISPAVSQHILLYFSKGNEAWGNALNCDSLQNLYAIATNEDYNRDILVSPNPMEDYSIIKLPENSTSNYNILIFNLHGQLVFEKKTRGTNVVLSKGDLSPGYYIIEIRNRADKFFTSKLIVK